MKKSQTNIKRGDLSQPLFANHLEKLELLSLATRRITQTLPHNAHVEKVICRMWDMLADFINTQSPAELSELSTLSSVIQRTASAAKQVQSLEDDSVDFVRKAVDFDAARLALLQNLRSSLGKQTGITPKTLQLIEQELRLL